MGVLKINVLGLLLLDFLVVLNKPVPCCSGFDCPRHLSWISQGRGSVEYVLYQLTEPLPRARSAVSCHHSVVLRSIGIGAVLYSAGINFLMLDLVGPLWNQL